MIRQFSGDCFPTPWSSVLQTSGQKPFATWSRLRPTGISPQTGAFRPILSCAIWATARALWVKHLPPHRHHLPDPVTAVLTAALRAADLGAAAATPFSLITRKWRQKQLQNTKNRQNFCRFIGRSFYPSCPLSLVTPCIKRIADFFKLDYGSCQCGQALFRNSQ